MKKRMIAIMLSVLILMMSAVVIPVGAAESKAERYLASMSTEDKISMMLMPVFRYSYDAAGNRSNVAEITADIEAALRKYSLSGVIMMGQNALTNEGAARLTDALQKANVAGGDRPQLLITIDQEGGNVTRLGQGTMTPGNMALGAINEPSVTAEVATTLGNELKAVGVNADFAPDVDVNNNPANPVIGVRSFSDDANIVAQHSKVFVEALNQTGVISTLKHFPGHGDTDIDSHSGLPSINKTYDELKQNELIPFEACIDAGAQMIMTAHIVFPKIEKSTYISKETGESIFIPATLSKKVITDILRNDMDYDGVVITDAMEMDAIAKHFDKFDAAKLAIEAGVDILLAPVNTPSLDDDYEGFRELDEYIAELVRMANSGEISTAKIDAAVLRILKLKLNNGLFEAYDGSDIEQRVQNAIDTVGTKASHDREWEIAKDAITLVKNSRNTLPLTKPNQKTVVLVPYDDETIPMNYAVRKLTEEGKLPQGAVVEAYSYYKKSVDYVLPKIQDADNVVFMSEIYSASGLKNAVASAADSLADYIHAKGGKFIVMSVSLPYDAARFTKADAVMIAYLPRSMPVDPGDKVKEITQYGPNMPAALYMMFSAEDAPKAKLPINIPKLDAEFNFTDTILYERGFGLTYGTLLGDANLDGSVDVVDATTIQRYDVCLISLGEAALELSDVDSDGCVSVIDATWIQRWELGMKAPQGIGKLNV